MARKAKKLTKNEVNSQDNCSDTGTTISQLNDDCLRCILAYLPFKDRIRLQRVSKRWQILMPWNGQKTLVIKDNEFRLGQNHSGQNCYMTCSPPVIKKVLHLCGNFLTAVELVCETTVCEDFKNYLWMFKNLCPHLVNLELICCAFTKSETIEVIQILNQNFSNLKSFGIGDIKRGCEKELTKFFLKAKDLREMKFSSSTLKGSCLAALPLVSLEKCVIIFEEDMLLGNVRKAFQSMNNLSTLGIEENLLLIENFDGLLNELPNRSNLKSLSLNLLFDDWGRMVQMKNLRYLTNLQELHLSGPQVVHDQTLNIIGNTCTKLKKATLMDSYNLTDDGWKSFFKLTNIEELKIGLLENISDKCFDHLQASSLKTLLCHKINLTNKSLQTLLKSADKLNHLDVALCPQVNCATLIKDISAQIESQPKYESFTLRLEIDDNTEKVTNISSRLILEKTNPLTFVPRS